MEENATSKVNDKVRELKNLVNHIVTEEELKEGWNKVNTEAEKIVKENPIPALLGAFAVGFILGKIIR